MFRFPPALMFAALLPLSLHVVSDATAANVSGDRKSATAPPGSTPDYPYRPVRFIVTFAPGGSDVVARMLGLKLSEKLGQPFVVDNRPGAGSTLGTAIAAKAAADGYTLLFATGSFAVALGFYKNLPYDPVKDFAAVGSVGSQPFMLVTHPSVPANSVKELIQSNDFRERLAALGVEPVVSTPKEFADFLQAEIAKWARVIKDAGVSLN